MKAAILGATSHVAKNLIVGLAGTNRLSLFARSIESVAAFLEKEGVSAEVLPLDSFGGDAAPYDAIINCIGFGTPEKVRTQGGEIFALTERTDNAILTVLAKSPDTTYVNFSSGAVYGTDSREPVASTSEFRIRLDSITVADAYRIAKLNSEAKHRSWPGHSIIDLRLFSFFSRFIDMNSSYLVTEMVNAIRKDIQFVTNSLEIVRDYVHPQDLCDLVSRCAQAKGINRPFDVYSSRSVRKSEIIRAFQERFGMKVRMVDGPVEISPTGVKSCYASDNQDAGQILGYAPRYTSLDALLEEAHALLKKKA
jgi:nucleoside-diphosphate-sugar epimerase